MSGFGERCGRRFWLVILGAISGERFWWAAVFVGGGFGERF